ncbi:MAG TPA: ABC transporter substrate-binding protein [Methylomirabilota bacterium]|nr:ABC transporter substrate-binding protein [Methylomirabilota bacterium]
MVRRQRRSPGWQVLALGLFLILDTFSSAAEAQSGTRTYRLGVLANAFEVSEGPLFDEFLEGLKKAGYVEGKNLVVEWRSSEGQFERLPALAAELVRAKVDVIVASSALPAHAAAEATRSIPVVFLLVSDPVGQKLVGSLSRPGGNVTGLATFAPDVLTARRMQVLKEAVPRASRVAVLSNPANATHRELLARELPVAAQAEKLTLVPLAMRAPGDLEGAFEQAARERADSLYVLGDPLSFVHRSQIADMAVQRRLPSLTTTRIGVEVGGLVSYGPKLRDLYRRAAIYVDRIFRGARPADLPVEQPPQFELVVNLKTARALGITLPQSLLRRADEVIQ